MYKPPERIRHALPLSRAPTADEAAGSILFSPLLLASGTRLRERTWVPAMVPWRATDDGVVTRDILDWYGRFAAGEPGAIVVEATGIRDVPSGPLLRIGDDRFLPGLADLVRTVREKSGGRTRLFIQIIDFLRIRRRPDAGRFLRQFLRLDGGHRQRLATLAGRPEIADHALVPEPAVRELLAELDDAALDQVLLPREIEALRFGERERVGDVHLDHVRELPRVLPELFARAAQRALTAGFDGVELHYAHAYTMASFLSALNRRDDGYGGARENRVRLPLEVYRAVRGAVGPAFTVGCRFLCDEIIEGGNRASEASWFGERFAAAGMDYLSLSTGGKFEDAAQPRVGEAAYPYTGKSGWECMPTAISDARGPFGRHVDAQAAVRAAVRAAGLTTPVVLCGGIRDFDQAEGYLRSGKGDLIGAARQSLADPDWFMKLRIGRGAAIRQCTYTNYCEALDQRHRKVTCKLWDREGLADPAVTTTDDGRRRLLPPPWRP
jgi:2,4-dienoyl-CoA reductase-like NADH-dependent reductase (Old Yellow Enzyme family)